MDTTTRGTSNELHMRACPTNSPSIMDELMEFRAHGNELAQEDRLDLDEEVIY